MPDLKDFLREFGQLLTGTKPALLDRARNFVRAGSDEQKADREAAVFRIYDNVASSGRRGYVFLLVRLHARALPASSFGVLAFAFLRPPAHKHQLARTDHGMLLAPRLRCAQLVRTYVLSLLLSF